MLPAENGRTPAPADPELKAFRVEQSSPVTILAPTGSREGPANRRGRLRPRQGCRPFVSRQPRVRGDRLDPGRPAASSSRMRGPSSCRIAWRSIWPDVGPATIRIARNSYPRTEVRVDEEVYSWRPGPLGGIVLDLTRVRTGSRSARRRTRSAAHAGLPGSRSARSSSWWRWAPGFADPARRRPAHRPPRARAADCAAPVLSSPHGTFRDGHEAGRCVVKHDWLKSLGIKDVNSGRLRRTLDRAAVGRGARQRLADRRQADRDGAPGGRRRLRAGDEERRYGRLRDLADDAGAAARGDRPRDLRRAAQEQGASGPPRHASRWARSTPRGSARCRR